MSSLDIHRALLVPPEQFAATLIETFNTGQIALDAFSLGVRDNVKGYGRLPKEYISAVSIALVRVMDAQERTHSE